MWKASETMQKTVYNGNKPYIFVSYAHKDSDVVVPAIQAMQSAGCRVWFDLGIEVGTEWSNNIAQHLRDCSLFVAFISPNSMKSENCLDEISYAKSHQKATLLIFLEEDVQMPEGTDMQTARFQRMYLNRQKSLQAFADSVREAPLFEPCRGESDTVAIPSVTISHKKSSHGKKPVYIGIAAAILALALVCIFVLPAVWGSTAEITEPTETTEPVAAQLQMSDNLLDYCFCLDGKVYKLPFAITDMLTDGWEVGDSSVNLDTMIKGLGESEIRMVKGNAAITVEIYNKSGHVKTVKDCMVGAVTVYADDEVDFALAKGITAESDKDAIVAAFGQPNFTENSSYAEEMIYAKSEYDDIGVWFVDFMDEGVVTDHKIVMCNQEGLEGDSAETSTEVPRFLSEYVAPTQLGDDLVSGNIQLQGKLYHIPCPVQEFLDDGWQITSKPGFVPGCRTADLTIEKEGTRLSVTVTNLTMTQTLPENCAVTTLMAYDAGDISLELPGGVYYGMSVDELSAMELPDFERTEFTYSVHFDYSEFDEREMSLYLDCDKEYGVLNSVWLKCETWDYPTE